MEDVLGRDEYAITSVGIVFRKPVQFDLWQLLGDQLMFYHAGLQWMLGDWLLYGEKASWSEQFSQALDQFSIEYSTLMNYRRIATIFPIGSRWAKLSWTHHREVAEMTPEQQQFWLKSAADNKWSIRDMLHHMTGGQIGDASVDDLLAVNEPRRKVLKSLLGLSPVDREWVVSQAAGQMGMVLIAKDSQGVA